MTRWKRIYFVCVILHLDYRSYGVQVKGEEEEDYAKV